MNEDKTGKSEFDAFFEKAYGDKRPDFEGNVHIAFVGKVSAGKSSLINALFERTREDPIADVGARAGIQTQIHYHKFDEKVLVVDCPGLKDVREEHSDISRKFFTSIDLGIFVVTDAADVSEKQNYDELKASCKNCLVVLNKIDLWDDLEESAIDGVAEQWKQALGVDRLFKTCAKGYDPSARKSAPMDIRGVNELRDAVLNFLKINKKDILLSRLFKNKDYYALTIIAGALVAVAAEAFIPGSAAYITATQVISITSLHYLYTGLVIDKSAVLLMLPSFVGQAFGENVFLWAKSFLPPTLILDVAAAAIAVVVTFAMLGAVRWMLVTGHSLDDRDELKDAFSKLKVVGPELSKLRPSDLKNTPELMKILRKLLGITS